MNEITIPVHLGIPSILCIVGLLTILINRKKLFGDRKRRLFWISVTAFLTIYLFIVGSATYDDIYYQWDLNRYDLNKDGFYSGNEITKEQMAAEIKLTNDVARNFSFITGFIFSAIISVAIFFVGKVIYKSQGVFKILKYVRK